MASGDQTDAEWCVVARAAAANYIVLGAIAAAPLHRADGNVLPGSPNYSIVVGAIWEQPITDSLTFDIATNLTSLSKTLDSVGDIITVTPTYKIVDINVGSGGADEAWWIAGFVRNPFKAD